MTSTRQLRSSKRRALTQNADQHPPFTSSSMPMHTPKPHLPNKQSFLSLSDEIYLEIISHLPAFPFPTQHQRKEVELYGPRRLALDALSRTCQALRRIFLRYRWQRIEVYHRMDLGEGPLPKIRYKNGKTVSGSKVYVLELVRQLETVTVRDPGLVKYVNVLDIFVADYSAKTILPELARSIVQMPNLHTVHIHFDIGQTKLVGESFAAYTYPKITDVYIPTNGSSFLHCCPAVKMVNPLWPRWNNIQSFLEDIIPTCPSIEVLGPIPVLGARLTGPFETRSLGFYILLISQLKSLRDVSFELNELPTDLDIKQLQKIPSMRTIRLVFKLRSEFTESDVSAWRLSDMERLVEGKPTEIVVTVKV